LSCPYPFFFSYLSTDKGKLGYESYEAVLSSLPDISSAFDVFKDEFEFKQGRFKEELSASRKFTLRNLSLANAFNVLSKLVRYDPAQLTSQFISSKHHTQQNLPLSAIKSSTWLMH